MAEQKKDSVDEEIKLLEDTIHETDLTDPEYNGYVEKLKALEEIQAGKADTARKDAESAQAAAADWARIAIDAGKVLGGLVLTAGCFVAGMNFEQTGTFTATSLKNLVKDSQSFWKFLK